VNEIHEGKKMAAKLRRDERRALSSSVRSMPRSPWSEGLTDRRTSSNGPSTHEFAPVVGFEFQSTSSTRLQVLHRCKVTEAIPRRGSPTPGDTRPPGATPS